MHLLSPKATHVPLVNVHHSYLPLPKSENAFDFMNKLEHPILMWENIHAHKLIEDYRQQNQKW